MPDASKYQEINTQYQGLYDEIHGYLTGAYKDLASKVNKQNNLLDRQIQESDTEQSTAFTQGDYENQSTTLIKNILKYTTYGYYIMAVIFFLVLFINFPAMAWYIKIVIGLIAGLYLYWILYLENILYKFFSYIYSIVMIKLVKNVYITPDKLNIPKLM